MCFWLGFNDLLIQSFNILLQLFNPCFFIYIFNWAFGKLSLSDHKDILDFLFLFLKWFDVRFSLQ